MNHLDKLKLILPPYLSSRLLILIIIIFAQQTKLETIPAKEGLNYNPQLKLSISDIPQNLKRIFSSADADWYFKIAETGYHKEKFTIDSPKNWVFFPLFPLTIKSLNYFTNSSITSALIISHLAFMLSLYFLLSLLQHLGIDIKHANKILYLICFYPVSYFFSTPITESLFFLLLILSWYFLEKQKGYLSAIFYSLLIVTRPTGLIILPAYLFALTKKKIISKKNIFIFSLIIFSPLAIFLYYLQYLTGNFLAFSQNQLAWNRGVISFPELIKNTLMQANILIIPWNFILLNILLAVLGLFSAVWQYKKKRYDFSLIILLPLLVSLSTGSYMSLARFSLVSFPIYISFVEMVKSERYFYLLLSVFSMIFAIMTLLYSLLVTSAMA